MLVGAAREDEPTGRPALIYHAADYVPDGRVILPFIDEHWLRYRANQASICLHCGEFLGSVQVERGMSESSGRGGFADSFGALNADGRQTSELTLQHTITDAGKITIHSCLLYKIAGSNFTRSQGQTLLIRRVKFYKIASQQLVELSLEPKELQNTAHRLLSSSNLPSRTAVFAIWGDYHSKLK